MAAKKHHYISQTYLRSFVDQNEKAWVYSKENAEKFWPADPSSIAYEKYYYSQPLPGGGRDDDALEAGFSSYESEWPALVKQMQAGERVDGSFERLMDFVAIHRVRVPTMRNIVEQIEAAQVRMNMLDLQDKGQLPNPPEILGDNWDTVNDNIVISIDPHRSIHAMAPLLNAFETVVRAIGFEILTIDGDLEFITSDNPVCYFDPIANETLMEPYTFSRTRMDIELLFPITPKILLWGHSALHAVGRKSVVYRSIDDPEFVARINRTIIRFADRYVFAASNGHAQLVKRYSSMSPIAEIRQLQTRQGRAIAIKHVFGKRIKKPKWEGS